MSHHSYDDGTMAVYIAINHLDHRSERFNVGEISQISECVRRAGETKRP